MRDAEEPRPKEETSPLDAVWQFLWRLRRRWLIVAVAVIASAAASVLAVARMTPYYSARATIVIHASAPQVLDDVRGVNEEELWTPTAYAEYSGTQREILKSRRVSELALKRLELRDDPTFLGVSELPKAEQEEAIKAADPVARLQSLVKVGNVPDSRVVWVAVEYPDPEMAAELVNAVTASYLEVVTSKRETTGEEAKTQLEAEKEAARERLRDKEKELDEFKQDNGITTISLADRQNITTQNILILTRESKEAEARRIAAAAVHDEAKRLAKSNNNAVGALVPKAERIDFD
ncbi:MAG: Wzz/FepE/Etk N-terminal domain-containing protein, partial [Myxococcota bacterium]